jgi:transcription-repair coupling factor (superfamily II helicase)
MYKCLTDNPALAAALDSLAAGKPISIDGVIGSACALTVLAVAAKVQKTILTVAANPESAEALADDIETLAGTPNINVLLFPPLQDDEYDVGGDAEDNPFALSDVNFGSRIHVLKYLNADAEPSIIVTSMPALLPEVIPRELLAERTQTLSVSQRIDLEQLRLYLVGGGYQSVPAVDLPGEFAVRGYILDIFAPDWQQPVRIELFDDEIESIRRFDSVTQRSLDSITSIDLTRVLPSESSGALLLDYLAADTPVVLISCE